MNYKNLLRDYINNSGKSLQTIADELTGKGHPVTRSYISKLQNGKTPPATDEMNRVLAEVLGGDPVELITAAYLEKAPPEMHETVKRLAEAQVLAAGLKIAEAQHQIAFQNYEKAEERVQDVLSQFTELGLLPVPVLDSVPADRALRDLPPVGWEVIQNSESHSVWDVFAVIQQDDSMSGARIYEGDKVLIQSQDTVEDRQIALLHLNDSPAILRRVFPAENNYVVLTADNNNFEPLIVKRSEIKIRGMVKQVIFDPNR